MELIGSDMKILHLLSTQGQIQVWANPHSPPPPPTFWQLNNAISAYLGAISANFPQFQLSAPLFLQILDPAL